MPRIFPRSSLRLAAASAAACMLALAVDAAGAAEVTTSELFVPHLSTLAANAGELMPLHLHHKVLNDPDNQTGRVVLFVHGATVPSVPAFDLAYKDYGWMDALARAGFDVWSMDMSGYGASGRPMMDDPCNVNPQQQEIIIKHPLAAPCAPHYPVMFKTVTSDWSEIDSAVDFIRHQTGVEKLNLVGWSAGGPRAGGYAAQHPEKVARLMLYAPSVRKGFVPSSQPDAGYPIALQTRADLEHKRWDPDVRCDGQVEPGLRDALWTQIMQWDHVGASWGPEEGVMRGPTLSKYGWSPEMAGQLEMPVLVTVGEFDNPDVRRAVYDAVGSPDKLFVKVACASHFMLWEKQHTVLQNISLQFLRDGKVDGASRGAFAADADGKLTRTE